MRSFRPPRGGSLPAALPALLRATHFLVLALGSAFGRLRESGVTAARMFVRAEEQALLLRMIDDVQPPAPDRLTSTYRGFCMGGLSTR